MNIDSLQIMCILKDNADRIFLTQAYGMEKDWELEIKTLYIHSILDVCSQMGFALSEHSVVDIGCSRCDMLLALRELGFEDLYSVNLTPFPLLWLREPEEFRKYWGESLGKIRYYVCDVDYEKLPFEDCTKSIILICDVLEHLHNPQNILSESYRVLKESGLLLMGTPNVANLKNRLRLLMGKSIYCNLDDWLKRERFETGRYAGRFFGHVREYSMKELERLLILHGFKVLVKQFIPTAFTPRTRNIASKYLGRVAFLSSSGIQIYRFIERLYPAFRYVMLVIGQKQISNGVICDGPRAQTSSKHI